RRAVARFFRRREAAPAGVGAGFTVAPQKVPGAGGPGPATDAPQAAAQLRDPPARCRGGLAQRAGAPRPCAPGHHAGLYALDHRTAPAGVRRIASAGVGKVFSFQYSVAAQTSRTTPPG